MMRIKKLSLIAFTLFGLCPVLLAQNVIDIAGKHLEELAIKNQFAPEDVLSPRISDYYTSGGIIHLYFQQTVDEIGIYGTSAAVHLKEDEIISSNLRFLKGLLKRNIKKQFQIQALEAVARVAIEKDYPLSQTELLILEADDEDPQKPTVVSPAGISTRTIPLRLLFVEDDNADLQLVWSIFVDEVDGAHYRQFLINATSGEIVREIDHTITCNFGHDHRTEKSSEKPLAISNSFPKAVPTVGMNDSSYNVFPVPIESPNFGQRSVVSSPWLNNSTASPNGWHQIDNEQFQFTRGNNVDAYDDSNNTNSPSNGDTARAGGGINLDFNHSLDLNSPGNSKKAAITNLFYWNNIIHDIWYNYGFDEPSGNFQENNFGKGGNEGDYVYAEAQDGSGTCNANFSTPIDGGNPRMQMFICGNRDGDLDNAVIIHEYGHGISIRLAGGPANSGCLGNQEQMGEGWSDWFGMVMTMQQEDIATKARPIGTWLFQQGPDGAGIRPYPYTTDMSINPMTYGTLTQENISIPHGVGSVWATMLWDLTWAMIGKYGWDADLYNGTGGNNRTMKLVLEGLKIQPCSPGFVDGRDAILAADRLLNGGTNECLIWETFARRGLGYSASHGNTNNKSDGTEAFDLPPFCSVSLTKTVNKVSAALGENLQFQIIAINNKNVKIDNLVLQDFLPDDLEFVSASNNGSTNGQTISWAAISLDPGQSKIETVTARVKSTLQEVNAVFSDDLEQGSTNWVIQTETGEGTWNYQNNFSNSGSNAFHAPGIAPDSYANLISADTFNIADQSELIFFHHYDLEADDDGSVGWDAGVVQLSIDNGATWKDLDTNFIQNGYSHQIYYGYRGFSGKSNGWLKSVVDLSAYAGNKALIRFQMRHDPLVFRPGWYIDDISVTNQGLSVINRVQISNGTLTTTAFADSPTNIVFGGANCTDGLFANLNNNPIPSAIYRVNVDLQASGEILSGSDVQFFAGNSISLQPGFTVEAGASFEARIEMCVNADEENISDGTDPFLRTTQIAPQQDTLMNVEDISPSGTLNLKIFPNPFRDQFYVHYHLSNPGKIRITLTDLTGKIIRKVSSDVWQQAGSHEISVSASHLSSGAYWLNLQTDQEVATQKIILIE